MYVHVPIHVPVCVVKVFCFEHLVNSKSRDRALLVIAVAMQIYMYMYTCMSHYQLPVH